MRLDAFLVGLVFFSLVMVAGTNIALDMSNNYDSDFGGEYIEQFDLEKNMSQLSIDQKDKMFGDADSKLTFLDAMIKQAKGVYDLLTKPIRMVYGMTEYFTEIMGISPIFATAFNTILTLSVVFGVAYLYFRIRSW